MNDFTRECLIQGTQAWKDLRKKMITASMMPVIMGISPWSTPYELWLQQMDLSEQEENWAMVYGKETEPEARSSYENETGEMMFPSVEFSLEFPWAMASLDGINLERTKILEIKCSGEKNHQMALSGEIPDYYQCQMQFQMFVTGLKENHYYSYRQGKGILIPLKRDQAYIDLMIPEAIQFYQYLIDKVPPPLTERDLVDQNEEWQKKAQEYYAIRDQRLAAETLEDQLRKELINLSNSRSSKGGGYTFKKTYRKGSIEYQAIPELVLIDLEQYRKPASVSWTISKAKEE